MERYSYYLCVGISEEGTGPVRDGAGDSPAVGGPREASAGEGGGITFDGKVPSVESMHTVGSNVPTSETPTTDTATQRPHAGRRGCQHCASGRIIYVLFTTHHLRGAFGVGRRHFLEGAEGHQLGLLRGATAARRAATSRRSDSLTQLLHFFLDVFWDVFLRERLELLEHCEASADDSGGRGRGAGSGMGSWLCKQHKRERYVKRLREARGEVSRRVGYGLV